MHAIRRTGLAIGFLAAALFPKGAAAADSWLLNEVFTNADGSVQFIEITTIEDSQEDLNGTILNIKIGDDIVNSFNFPSDGPEPTAGQTYLLGTSAFAALPGAPAPDFIIPAQFLPVEDFFLQMPGNFETEVIGIPINGVQSAVFSAQPGANSPVNFAGELGSVNASNGAIPAVISVSSNGSPVPSDSIFSLGTFPVAPGTATRVFTVNNFSQAALHIRSITADGDFTNQGGLPGLMFPGDSETFTLEFSTAAQGTKTSNVVIDCDHPGGFRFTAQANVSGAEADVAVGANPVPSNGAAVSFGTIHAGDAATTRTFTVGNPGFAPLTTGNLVLPAGFTLIEPLAATIPPSGSDSFTVAFTRTSAGAVNAQISFANNDFDENPYLINVTGTVTGPEIALIQGVTELTSGGSINLGTVPRGDIVNRLMTVRNDGTEALTIASLALPAHCTLIEPLTGPIAPGGTENFTIQVSTGIEGAFNAPLTITTNDFDEAPFILSIEVVVDDAETAAPRGTWALYR